MTASRTATTAESYWCPPCIHCLLGLRPCFNCLQGYHKGMLGVNSATNFQQFQQLVSGKIPGLDPQQFNIVIVCSRAGAPEARQHIPIHENTNFCVILNQHNPSRDKAVHFLVTLKRPDQRNLELQRRVQELQGVLQAQTLLRGSIEGQGLHQQYLQQPQTLGSAYPQASAGLGPTQPPQQPMIPPGQQAANEMAAVSLLQAQALHQLQQQQQQCNSPPPLHGAASRRTNGMRHSWNTLPVPASLYGDLAGSPRMPSHAQTGGGYAAMVAAGLGHGYASPVSAVGSPAGPGSPLAARLGHSTAEGYPPDFSPRRDSPGSSQMDPGLEGSPAAPWGAGFAHNSGLQQAAAGQEGLPAALWTAGFGLIPLAPSQQQPARPPFPGTPQEAYVAPHFGPSGLGPFDTGRPAGAWSPASPHRPGLQQQQRQQQVFTEGLCTPHGSSGVAPHRSFTFADRDASGGVVLQGSHSIAEDGGSPTAATAQVAGTQAASPTHVAAQWAQGGIAAIHPKLEQKATMVWPPSSSDTFVDAGLQDGSHQAVGCKQEADSGALRHLKRLNISGDCSGDPGFCSPQDSVVHKAFVHKACPFGPILRSPTGLEAVQAQADSIFASEAGSGAASQALSYQQQMPIASAAPGRHPVPPGFPLPQHSHDPI